MNKEEPYRDQAEKLKQKIEKYRDPNHEDADTLPPRSHLHRNKKKKTKLKLKFPLLRLLVVFFILLPITIFSIYSYIGNKHIGTEKTSVPSKGFETINFEKSKSQKSKQKTNSSIQQTEKKKSNSQQSEEEKGNEQNNLSQDQIQNDSQTTDQPDAGASLNTPSNPVPQENTTVTQSSNGNSQEISKKIIYHTVQPKETLYHIAIYYYHSKSGIETIKAANQLRTNYISTGQVLKIPLNEKPIKQ